MLLVYSAANRPSPTCDRPDEQMFHVASSRHQFHSQQQQQQQLLAPLTDAPASVDSRCPSAAASPSPSTPSPPGDSPPPPPVEDVPPASGSAQPAAVAAVAPRRRAVDASDLRQCALVQTRLKAWKSGYVHANVNMVWYGSLTVYPNNHVLQLLL